ncbi:CDP-alcohol phosphatidyltransferase family protein [Segetibacter koreensis]|uniref:CDP-alcohol phosphatidyltransferase family protein n=1 Tax=Segetibacter koreensis TaxID=398037 RepID=UPI00037270CA|nr:CDP-alcohol phosphatidyltransferase family protein [Segetibacter koreensis]
MNKPAYYIINAITLYRLIAAPVLLLLLVDKQIHTFSWLLSLSFFTDFIDGFLARRYKVTSVLGSRLDSIADDLTVLLAIIGLFMLKPLFIKSNYVVISVMLVLYILQVSLSLRQYGKLSSFHTYLAKIAAILQGVFFILMFFLPQPVSLLFYTTALVTIADIIEEIILVIVLPKWQTDVKGVYWILKKRRTIKSTSLKNEI